MELDCESCFLPFDKVLRRPKLLPCGHTCCLACLLLRRGESADCTVTCSEDKQICSEDPNKLPSNLFIVSLLDTNLDKSTCDTIVDEPKVQALERIVAVQQQKVDGLLRLQDELLEALQIHEDGRKRELHSVQDCLSSLEGPNWEQNMSEAAALLNQNLPLLGPRLDTATLSLRTAGPPSDKDDTWDSKELRLEDQPALQLAMLLLNKRGHLRHILLSQSSSDKQEMVPEDPELPIDVDLMEISTVPSTNHYRSQEKFQFLTKYPKVEVIRNLDCSVDKEWAVTVLKMHKYHLRHLEVLNARREHLCLMNIDSMTQLKYLKVGVNDMTLWEEKALIFKRPPFTSDSYGLSWLEVDGLPLVTVRSLLHTHAMTLKVLRLTVGTPSSAGGCKKDNWPKTFNGLRELLKDANLRNLASMILLRPSPQHDRKLCSSQLEDARNAIPDTCTVACEGCESKKKPMPDSP